MAAAQVRCDELNNEINWDVDEENVFFYDFHEMNLD
jgi:hypothetical protein